MIARVLIICALFTFSASFSWKSFSGRNTRSIYSTNKLQLAQNEILASNLFLERISHLTASDESDEGDDEDVKEPDTTSTAPIIIDDSAIVKEAAAFSTAMNGSDVRVGIIMARWNEDIIKNLYQV